MWLHSRKANYFSLNIDVKNVNLWHNLSKYITKMYYWKLPMCHFLSTPKCFYPKVIKLTSIGAQVEVPKICTCEFNFWKSRKHKNSKDLWKYGSILAIQKSLFTIWLWFWKESSHIKLYYFMLYHILNHYR
jgi:hypothetical protein